MKLPRRNFLHLVAGAVALPAVAGAQAYPTRPVRIIVNAAPGGANDVIARLMASWLSERLGQFVVENRPGGSGNIGTEAAIRAPPDGYTLLLVDSTAAINATLYDKLSFVFLRDIEPIAGILSLPYVLVTHPSVPANTVSELIAYARTNPGKINMASPSTGSGPHVAGELFKMAAAINMVHVPYRGGGPVMSDLLGGQVQVMFGTTALTIEQVKAGKLRPLAVTTAARWEGLPEIPTVAEFVLGYEASSVYGLGAPRTTPAAIIDRLNKGINVGLADSPMKARLADLGGTVLPGTPADFGKLMAEETEKWGKVIKAANIKLE
jgi:tripartite-type tricarboxylate transporter receptor subunit TctC